jgi:hypothetical protein
MGGMVHIKQDKQTTRIGYENRNAQTAIRRTDTAGTDHWQRVYVLRCTYCSEEYGANGSDIHHKLCPNRKCPSGQNGSPGIPH